MKINEENSLNEKINLILENQNILLKNDEKILKNQKNILKEEEKIETLEKEEIFKQNENFNTEEDAIKEIKKLEKELLKNQVNPISKITKRDLVKGFIGSFIGVMGHFAFTKGTELGKKFDIFQASVLYIVAFFIIILMLYYTGFRSVQKKTILKFLPLRACVLYSVSIITILMINFLFLQLSFEDPFSTFYKVVSASMILGVLGAGTADLIGKNE